MPQINAYLGFDGNTGEAMRFYERVLGGKLEALVKNGDTPAAEHVPADAQDRIMHAYLTFPGGSLMAGDSMPGEKYDGMKGFSLALQYDDTDEAKRVFEALSEGGKVTMEWSPTFWAEAFGMATDKYGTPWIVNGKSLPS
jgi:PhnB protein